MTTQEFQVELNKANSIIELKKLRDETGASKFIKMIKEKAFECSKIEGYITFKSSLSSLRNLTINTDTNSLFEIVIPEKNRTFSSFKGQKVSIYINHKEGTKTQTVYGFVKAI